MANQNSVVTKARRKSLAQITSGAITALPKIAAIALGDGGVQEDGTVLPPGEDQTELHHEVGRYTVAEPTFPVETTARYQITVPETELAGVSISEIALVDEAGTLCAIRTTSPKTKDGDEEFTFIFDDEF
ncbi:MAG: hypothetical protein HFF10_07360 [Angelakisella sp.]|jgi:hypothetical protein|nr:hypothetical protein [Angelakisella sp.]